METVLGRDGRAAGVVLKNGEGRKAKAVVTSVDPQIALLQHLDRKGRVPRSADAPASRYAGGSART